MKTNAAIYIKYSKIKHSFFLNSVLTHCSVQLSTQVKRNISHNCNIFKWTWTTVCFISFMECDYVSQARTFFRLIQN